MRVITGKARGVQLKTPDGMLTRPTTDRVKEALFSVIQFDIPGSRVLDLFGGTGQLGIEALSRGAKSAVFVDVRSDYLDYLSKCREQYDIIFLDPPYAEVFLENSLNRITEIDILHSGGIIVAERPLGKELPWDYPGYTRSRDYQYGKILLTFYRKDGGSQETI